MSLSYSTQLRKKLSLLKQQKKRHFYFALWRSLFLSSLTACLFYLASLPYWQIKERSQIKIDGNHTVTKDTIYSLLAFSYPQFIWSISTGKLSQNLKSAPPILDVKVNRQIFPPLIKVDVREKVPVAIALSSGKVGFLDAMGNWIPRHFYQNPMNNDSLLTLRVINFKSQYTDSWKEIYRLIILYYKVDIFEVIWQESGDLSLKTQLGIVYLGSPHFRLEEKFAVLARLQNLPTYIDRSQINYIDLSNPDLRIIEKHY